MDSWVISVAFAAINRGFRDIDSGEDFRAATFAPDPKRHRRLHRIFWTLKPAGGVHAPKLLCRGWVHALAVMASR